jgi:hypothetical protein
VRAPLCRATVPGRPRACLQGHFRSRKPGRRAGAERGRMRRRGGCMRGVGGGRADADYVTHENRPPLPRSAFDAGRAGEAAGGGGGGQRGRHKGRYEREMVRFRVSTALCRDRVRATGGEGSVCAALSRDGPGPPPCVSARPLSVAQVRSARGCRERPREAPRRVHARCGWGSDRP